MNIENVYINRTASFLPNTPVSNDEMELLLGKIDNRTSRFRRQILKINGIKTRYYAIDRKTGQRTHSNAELTAESIRKLAGNGFSLDEIECLACGTTSPDQLAPSHGVMVHGELQNANCEVVTTAGICSSGMQALKYGYLSVACGQSENAVCTGSELSSSCMRGTQFEEEMKAMKIESLKKRPILSFEKEFLRWMLSDGSGAVLLQKAPDPRQPSLKIDWIDIHSFANELPVCMYMGANRNEDGTLTGFRDFSLEDQGKLSILSLKQDVRLLNKQMVTVGVKAGIMSQKKRGLNFSDIDYILPHVSSQLFADELEKGLLEAGIDIPKSKWFMNLSSVGNMGAASIFSMLDDLCRSGQLKSGDKLLVAVPESGRFTICFALLTVM